MAQYDFGTIDPNIVDGTELASMLNQWRDAIYTMQRGPTRPAFVVPGQLWTSDAAGPSDWRVNYYISPTLGDVSVFSIDTVAGTVTLLLPIDVAALGALLAANNLSDLTDKAQARLNLQLGALAQKDSVSGTDIVLTGQATGDLMWRSATGWARVPPGTAGQVLQSNGPAAAPTWVAASGPAASVAAFARLTSVTADGIMRQSAFATPSINLGGYLVGNRFTPPAGYYRFSAGYSAFGALECAVYLAIYKNGVPHTQAFETGSNVNLTTVVDCMIQADGDDYFEVFALAQNVATPADMSVGSWFAANKVG